MPKYLSRSELYRVLQRELPADVYPDGAPSGFYSTADNDSIAAVIADAYQNLSRVYENFFPQTADEKISSWETKVFERPPVGNLTLAQRRQLVLDKLKFRKGIKKQDIINATYTIIGSDKIVEVREWGCSTGSWMIGVSQLGIETYLSGSRLVDAVGPGLCGADPADYGKTEQEWLTMREDAYTYEVRIYDYTMTATEALNLETLLLEVEPARSQHIVLDGLDPAEQIGGTT